MKSSEPSVISHPPTSEGVPHWAVGIPAGFIAVMFDGFQIVRYGYSVPWIPSAIVGGLIGAGAAHVCRRFASRPIAFLIALLATIPAFILAFALYAIVIVFWIVGSCREGPCY